MRRASADTADGASLADLVAGVVRPGATNRERIAAMSALVGQLAGSARTAGVRAVLAGRWISDVITELVPHLTVRDAAELRRSHPGLSDDAIAERLVLTASRLTAAVGAAAGALAAAEFAAPPTLVAAPIQLAAETVAVVTVEIRLVAELHEMAGQPVAGGIRHSAPAYLQAWIRRRAVGVGAGAGVGGLLGDATKRELRVRLMRRVGRSTATLAPFLAGAAAGAEFNRRSTRDLGDRVRTELRRRNRPHADVTIDFAGEYSARDATDGGKGGSAGPAPIAAG